MALTMSDRQTTDGPDEWPAPLHEEFAVEARRPNGCVGDDMVFMIVDSLDSADARG